MAVERARVPFHCSRTNPYAPSAPTRTEIVQETDELHQTLLRMRAVGVRRVAVRNQGGALVGVLSLDDVVGFLNETVRDLAGAISHEFDVERRLRE